MIDKIEVSSDGGRTWHEATEKTIEQALRCDHPFNWLVKTVNHEGLKHFCPLQAIRRMGIEYWKQEAEGIHYWFLPPGVSPFVELESVPVGETPLKDLYAEMVDRILSSMGIPPELAGQPKDPKTNETWRDRPPLL